MNKPKISVVTVCYNTVDTIEETMLSVLNQTYDNVEYIIIDGGSTDGTVDIIKKYADRLAYWVSEPDKGIYDAMNKGIDAATGDYIYFLGANDTLFSSDTFLKVTELINDKECSYYGDVIFRPIDKVYAGKFTTFKLIRKNICHQSIFYPSGLLKNNHYTQKYKAYSDYYQNIVFWGKGIQFKYLSLIIANFVLGGVSNKGDENFTQDMGKIIKNNMGIIAYSYYLLRVSLVRKIKRMLHLKVI